MVEERFYTYDQLGNMLSYRHGYLSAGAATGAFHVGGLLDGENNGTRGNFNGMSGIGASSTNYGGNAVTQYVAGQFGPPPVGGHTSNSRGAFTSGAELLGSANYAGAMGFNPLSGSGGVKPFVRGIKNGMGTPPGYSGPYGETIIDYTYGENGAGPHAVTSLSNGNTYEYDANGNMTGRVQDEVTWTQTFDAENRLVTVTDGTTTTSYVYDGSGTRVKRTVGNTTTIYVAGMEIEKASGAETKRTIYYPSGAFRVIVVSPSTNTVYYRHGDHLGSTSVLSDSAGAKVSGSDMVYAPFGEARSGTLSTLTDFGYTGQRLDRSAGGLMDYNARFYLPELRRFISPDTIVPSPENPQDFNRFTYSANDPINYVDPTGHTYCDHLFSCDDDKKLLPIRPPVSPPSPEPVPEPPEIPEDPGPEDPPPATPAPEEMRVPEAERAPRPPGMEDFRTFDVYGFILDRLTDKEALMRIGFMVGWRVDVTVPVPVVGTLDVSFNWVNVVNNKDDTQLYATAGTEGPNQAQFEITTGPLFGVGYEKPEDFAGGDWGISASAGKVWGGEVEFSHDMNESAILTGENIGERFIDGLFDFVEDPTTAYVGGGIVVGGGIEPTYSYQPPEWCLAGC